MELERLDEATNKLEGIQKSYNESSKNIATFLGRNLTLLVCMLVPLLLIAFVWVEFGEVIFQTHMIVDAVVTIALFAVGETMMVKFGGEGGKLDKEYIRAKDEFEEVVKKVGEIGTSFLGVFCDWQIDTELEQATNLRLRQLRLTPKMWKDLKNLTLDQLEDKYGKARAKKIFAIHKLEPIELNEAILLYNGEKDNRGTLPKSGEEFLNNKRQKITSAISLAFTGLLTLSIAVSLTTDISWARVIYTIYKLAMLLFRMVKGYERGATAYNTYEAKRYQAKAMYLKNYVKFVEDKAYMSLVGKYDELDYLKEV